MTTYIINGLDLEDIRFLAGAFKDNNWKYSIQGSCIKVIIPKIDRFIFEWFMEGKYSFNEVKRT